MGYDVHITRRKNWFDDEGQAITMDEWVAVVSADPEMRLDGFAEAELADGSALRSEDPSIAVWTAYSKHGQQGNMAWFALCEGNVEVKNPDQEILIKMWQLAQKLAAIVQGDEGELYGAEGVKLSNLLSEPIETFKEKPWWRFW